MKVVLNMFKINNKDNRTASLTYTPPEILRKATSFC